jgi:diguanylate cyclase (GGDEF)-like protein
MQIDGFTVVLIGLFIKALLGVLFLAFWATDARATWFAWWSATFLLGGVAGALLISGNLAPEFLPIGFGIAVLLTAFGCCWQGARAFEGRPPTFFLLLAAPVLWLAVCLIPGFLGNVHLRVVLSGALLAVLGAMTAIELWRGRQEPLPSRWGVIVLFASLSVIFAARIPLVGVLPFPFGALPMQSTSLAGFNLLMFLHSIVLAVLTVAMSKERLELEQRQKAQTDLLTGALNQRAFMAYGSRLLLRHKVEEQPLCLLFLDVDRFKSFNDRFGHAGGDEVLVKFVAVVRDSIRSTDFLFRIGGEEFCCLLPHTRMDQAQDVAERVRQTFAATTVEVAGIPVKATVSLGIASTDVFGYDLDVLMRRADMAVYAAKRQGRNRVMLSTSHPAVASDADHVSAAHAAVTLAQAKPRVTA